MHEELTAIADRVSASVRAELARVRISGKQLARDLGIPYPILARRLNGEVAFRADQLARIAEYLDIPVQRLYGPPSDVEATGPHAVVQRPA